MNLKIRQIINYINLFSCILLVATSIYYYPVQKLAFWFFFSSYIIEIFSDQKWRKIKINRKTIYFTIMFFFFLFAFIYYPFDPSKKYFFGLLSKRLSILGFAGVGFFGLNDRYKLSYFLNTLIISSVVAILYLIFYRIGFISFILNPDHAKVFTEQRILYVNSHMVFNFYLNISIVSIWFILTQSWNRTKWWKRYLYIGALTIDFGILAISEGRSGFLAGIFVMFIFIFFEIWKRKKTMGIIIGLLFPFFLFSVASLHKRMSEKILEGEPRLFLWESAISVIKDKPIAGYGISSAQEHFDIARVKYQTEEFRLDVKKSYRLDAHDQYLQTTMEFGLIGLLILLFLYVYPIFIVEKNRKLFSLLLLLLCAYQSVFDMFITGQFSSLFGILVVLILIVNNNLILEDTRKHLKKTINSSLEYEKTST